MIAEQDRLRILAILAAVFAAIAFAVGELSGLPGTVGLAITGLVLAGAMWQARRISSFLRVFLTVFVLEYVAFGVMVLVSGLGWWPDFLAGLLPPASLPVTVGIFGILVVAVSHIPVIRTITRIADRYFDTATPTTARIGSLVAWSGRGAAPRQGRRGVSRPRQPGPGWHQRAPELLQPRLVQCHPEQGRGRLLVAALHRLPVLGVRPHRQRRRRVSSSSRPS